MKNDTKNTHVNEQPKCIKGFTFLVENVAV